MKVLLDTSFFLRLMDSTDPLCSNAKEYFEYMIRNKFELYISTIAISEFCVKNPFDKLPRKYLRILPFNVPHAIEAGHVYKLIREVKERRGAEKLKRDAVQSDVKQFGQAVSEKFDWYVSSDAEALKSYELFKDAVSHQFKYIDISTPIKEIEGLLF